MLRNRGWRYFALHSGPERACDGYHERAVSRRDHHGSDGRSEPMNLDVNYSPERAVSERDHGHSRDQKQERDQGCDRDVLRSGHRREFDARYPRRSLSDRVEGVVRDVGTFRTVALVDIANRQFDGHPFAARQGIAQAEQQDWIVRQQAQGPTGRPYTLLVARARGWPQPARPQRRQSGVRGVRAVRPWRVAVGLTMTGGTLAVWALWLELAHLRPYGPVRSRIGSARSGGSSRQCSTSSPPVPVPTPNGPRCNGPARRPPGLVVRRPRRRWVLAPDVSRRGRARSTPSSGRSASRRVTSAPRTNHRGTPTRRAGTPSSGWRNG